MEIEEEIILKKTMKELGVIPIESNTKSVDSNESGVEIETNKTQQKNNKNTQKITANQILSEQAITAKTELEILVATGKTQDFVGKRLTFNDLDYMSEKDLLKYYRLYQSALAVRVNDTFSKIIIKSYSTFVGFFLPIEDKEKLYDDLRNDYILAKIDGLVTLI
jgi:hypothetical protein